MVQAMLFLLPPKADSSLAVGRYVLRLTVTDGELTTSNDVGATVSRSGSGGTELWLLIIFVMAAVFKLVTAKRS